MLQTSKAIPSAMNSRLSVFRKMLKKRCQKGSPQSHDFRYKNDHWASKGRFIAGLDLIWGDVARGVEKSIKIVISGTKGRKMTKDPSPGGALQRRTRPQGGGRGRENLASWFVKITNKLVILALAFRLLLTNKICLPVATYKQNLFARLLLTNKVYLRG